MFIYTEDVHGINVHKYGAHIFHTSDKEVWDYVNQFAEFNNYINAPIAVYKDELYNLPFNMNTFSKMWGIRTPAEAEAHLQKERAARGTAPARGARPKKSAPPADGVHASFDVGDFFRRAVDRSYNDSKKDTPDT